MTNIYEFAENPVLKGILDRYEKAQTPEELEAAKQYQRDVQERMGAAEKEEFSAAFVADTERMLSAMDEDIADLRAEAMRQRLGDVPKAISLTYIAAQCGKSKSWLSQRLNGHKVNGKEAHFTSDEARLVQGRLHELGRKLLNVALI